MNSLLTLIKQKDNNSIQYVEPKDLVVMAIGKMFKYDLGAILVIEKGQIVGIFTERDYTRKLLIEGKSSLSTHIEDVMNPNVIYVTLQYTVEECLNIMTTKKISYLPVIDDNQLLSVVTISEVAKTLIDDQYFQINEYNKYISGPSNDLCDFYPDSLKSGLIWNKNSASALDINQVGG